MTRPLGVRSKAVKQNNIALILTLNDWFRGTLGETIQGFLGSYLPQVEREGEDISSKTKYLWQDTLEELALRKKLTLRQLVTIWPYVATPNKPNPPPEILESLSPLAETQPAPVVTALDEEAVEDDVDVDEPLTEEAPISTETLDDLDMDHDTYDTFADVFNQWPYINVHDHKQYGKLLVLGQLSGRNRHNFLVYKGCKLNDDSFGKIGCIGEYERNGTKDSTWKIKVLKLRPGVVKFWVNVDDPSRAKGQRDLEAMYRYIEITADGLRAIDHVAYMSIKNQLTAA